MEEELDASWHNTKKEKDRGLVKERRQKDGGSTLNVSLG